MSNAQDKTNPIAVIAVQASNFSYAFLKAAKQSPEKGAFAAIAFTSDLHKMGVSQEEAFEAVCKMMGHSINDLPKRLDEAGKEPSENADLSLVYNYKRTVAGNALAIAKAALGLSGKEQRATFGFEI